MRPTIYYNYIKSITLDISALSNRISSNKYERYLLIKKCEPSGVRSVAFDDYKVCKKVISDNDALAKIRKLSNDIAMDQMLLDEKKNILDNLREQGIKAASELNDLKLKIFIMAFIDNMSNEMIASELGYSIQTVWNNKVEINKIFEIDIN